MDSEGTAIGGWNAAGPFYIRNNHLSSSAITTIFGGAVPNIQGLRAVGLTFLDNHYYRPWKWRSTSGTIDPGGMCLYDENGGEYYRNTSNGTYWNCVNGSWSQIPENQFSLGYFNKNQFELKNASQAWVEGNVLENGWLPTFQNQHGAAFLMNQVDNAAGISLGEPAAIVEYVWVRNNLVRNTPWGISTGQLGSYFRPMHDIFYDNNLFVNLGAEPQSLGDNRVLQTSNTGRLRFSRNTAIVDRITKGTVIGMDAAITDGMEFYGNIVGFNEGGFQNSFSGGGNLWNAFDGAWTLNRAMSKNVVVNNQHRIISGAPHPVKNIQTPSDVTGLITCASCAIPEYYENGGTNDVGFENFSAEDLRLKSTSLYGPGWGHMGKAAGADIDVVRWSTEHAEDGQSNAYLDFVVRNVSVTDSSAAISYTALDTSTCTVTTSGQPDYGNPVSTDFDTGGDQNRTVMVGGLSANTRYFYRIECGLDGYRREGVLLTLP